jgi:aspartate 1-decarboxylase
MPLRTFLRGKIHRATVTDADVDYVGSVSLDPNLIEAAGFSHLEQVDILDVTNGHRLTTYVLTAERGSGDVCINGAAAHLVSPGDVVILVAYAQVADDETGPVRGQNRLRRRTQSGHLGGHRPGCSVLFLTGPAAPRRNHAAS